jgi:predicted MFS family arabinose efflux permease
MSRFLAGLPHGAFFGVGTIVAIKLSKKGKEAQAVSSMFTGLTLAILLLVPFLTYIGHNTSYKWAFLIVSLLGIFTILALIKFMPKLKSLKTVTFKEEIEFFLTFKAWHIILIVAMGFDYILSYAGVAIFVGLTAWDSQKIKQMLQTQYDMSEGAQKLALIGALTLYLDFINLFLYLLRIFGGSNKE